MANRRMFSLQIIDTDFFLDLPQSSQNLYFHLSLRADDDGFISAPKRIMRMVGSSEDDYKLLIAKNFVIPFESGVCVITHWKIHNYIRKDRYTPTFHKYEKSMLDDKDDAYELLDEPRIQSGIPSGSHSVDHGLPQDRLGKDRLGKDRLGKDRLGKDKDTTLSKDKICSILSEWNSLDLQELKAINAGTNRYKLLKVRISEYGFDEVLRAISSIKQSSFLRGQNDRGWTITFDWLIKPNNFVKVIEGNYLDKGGSGNGQGPGGNSAKTDYSYLVEQSKGNGLEEPDLDENEYM